MEQKANSFMETMTLFAGRRGDQCIIFRDQGSTGPPPWGPQIYTCNLTSGERIKRGKFLVIILSKNYLNLHTYTHALLKSKQWISIYVLAQMYKFLVEKYIFTFFAYEIFQGQNEEL